MIKTETSPQSFVVIHPMFDVEEQKLDGAGLGRAKLSPAVRWGLILLRAYVIAVGLLLTYHVMETSGMFGHLSRS